MDVHEHILLWTCGTNRFDWVCLCLVLRLHVDEVKSWAQPTFSLSHSAYLICLCIKPPSQKPRLNSFLLITKIQSTVVRKKSTDFLEVSWSSIANHETRSQSLWPQTAWRFQVAKLVFHLCQSLAWLFLFYPCPDDLSSVFLWGVLSFTLSST